MSIEAFEFSVTTRAKKPKDSVLLRANKIGEGESECRKLQAAQVPIFRERSLLRSAHSDSCKTRGKTSRP